MCEFKKRLAGYSCCGQGIWDKLFQTALAGPLEVVQE
jgi:hypothetical protein